MHKEPWYKFDEKLNGLTSTKIKLLFYLWKYLFSFIFRATPEFCKRTRVCLLRLFGAKIGKGNYISSRSIVNKPWRLKIGNYNSIDAFVYFNGKVEIGNNVKVSSFVKFITAGHKVRSRGLDNETVPAIVGDSAFIGANTVIMKGVHIGTFSVIGANSFVIKDVPENSIAFGNPAIVKGKRLEESEYKKYNYDRKPL